MYDICLPVSMSNVSSSDFMLTAGQRPQCHLLGWVADKGHPSNTELEPCKGRDSSQATPMYGMWWDPWRGNWAGTPKELLNPNASGHLWPSHASAFIPQKKVKDYHVIAGHAFLLCASETLSGPPERATLPFPGHLEVQRGKQCHLGTPSEAPIRTLLQARPTKKLEEGEARSTLSRVLYLSHHLVSARQF